MEKIVNKFVGVILVIIFIIHFCIKSFFDSRKNVVNVIFWPTSLLDLLHYIIRGYLLQDYVLLRAIDKSGFKTKFVARKNLEKLPKNSVVCYSMTKSTKAIKKDQRIPQGESLYQELSDFPDLILFPEPNESRMWENKSYMHKVFDQLEISVPKTEILSCPNDLEKLDFNFPVLTKIPNSNQSKGIDLHKDWESLESAVRTKLNTSATVLLQEYMDIKFDIRVVVIAGRIVYHYWRHKATKVIGEFTTTSTTNGGFIDTKRIPDKVAKECIDSAKKLGLSMAAFDVTLRSNINPGEIVFFEVSPSFILNPIPKSPKQVSQPYHKYKAKVFRFNYQLINQFIEIKKLQVKEWKLERYLLN